MNDFSSLCDLCVLCASVVDLFDRNIHHRDTENTENAQRLDSVRLRSQLLNPIRDENVSIAARLCIAIRGEHQFLPIRRKHGKPVEGFVECDALEAAAVNVNFVKVKVATLRIVHVGGEDYSLAVWEEIGREVGFAIVRYLTLVGSVGIHHPDFQNCWPNQVLLE